MLTPFGFFMPGLMELLIIALIIGFPVLAVIVVLLIVQQQSRQRELRMNESMFSHVEQPAWDSEPVHVEVVKESGGKEEPA